MAVDSAATVVLLLLTSIQIATLRGLSVRKEALVASAGSTTNPPSPVLCDRTDGWRWLNVVPGTGWDNLVNEERGPTVTTDAYSKCLRSVDGRFLVPDGMTVEFTKSSQVDLTSEVVDSMSTYKSLTASSVNSATDIGYSYFHINGDFSFEKESLRQKSGTTRGLIVRSQLRHKRYTVRLMPDSAIHPRLRNRLLDIAAHLWRGNVTIKVIEDFGKGEDRSSGLVGSYMKENDLLAFEEGMQAFYQADLVIRDYGTHSISSVEAGGILVKTDTLDEITSQISRSEREKLAASATMTFANLLNLKAGGAFVANKTAADEYSRKVTNSHIVSHGGPIFRANNMELAEWEGGLDDNLVAIDRSGMPIYELITSRTLPELDESLILRLAETIKSAVQRYYAANAVIGCMDPTSVFYDKDANIATSECSEGEAQLSETTRLPLGGVFQKCHGPSELCNTLTVVNPATGNFTCSPGYFEVRLVAAQVRTCYNQCHRSIWGTPLQCHQECAVTESFWCSQNPSLPDAPEVDEDFGFMFEGLYTDKEPNSITHRFSCPEYSWPIAVGRKMRICLSADRELAGKYGIPFGGFYSCRDGNPLVTVLDRNETSPEGRKAFQKLLTHLNHFVTHQGRPILPRNDSRAQRMSEYQPLLAPIWPKRCPKGYTSHLASMEDACQINFCVPANRLKRTRKRYLKRPPFVDPPSFYEGSNPVSTVMKSKTIPNSLPGPHGEQLERVDGVWVRKGSMSSGTAETKLRNERIITIILGCIIAVLCAAMLAVVVPTIVHKRKITRLIPS